MFWRGSNSSFPGRARLSAAFSTTVLLAMLIAGLAGALAPTATAAPATAAPGEAPRSELTIVVLKEGSDPVAAARKLGVTPEYVYRAVFSGFAAKMPAGALRAADDDVQIDLISPDNPVESQAQIIPTGVRRIDAPSEWTGDPVVINAGVAVLDSGIQRKQARTGKKAKHGRDLNVVGGKSCIKGGNQYQDAVGHGTHVAGTIGARDNTYGVEGVAPGVRLFAVKVLNDRGYGSDATVICGLDWVRQHANAIDVVNMSLGGKGKPTTCDNYALHRAVCKLVDAGVSVVVASGNDGKNAANFAPANFAEAITVGAFGDFDGLPGGGGGTCFKVKDDTYAWFSNYGAVVDILAPGVCIRSTAPDGGIARMSGTSMATPHVAGALALYYAATPGASPAAAEAWLLSAGSVPRNSADGILGNPTVGKDQRVLFLGP